MTKTTNPINFEIKGEKHELKLTWNAVKQLNELQEGGSFELIGSALQGNMGTYSQVVFAGLLHTGKDYKMKQVEEAIGEAFENGKVTMSDVINTLYELLLENNFYKDTVERMLADSPGAKEAMDRVRGKK